MNNEQTWSWVYTKDHWSNTGRFKLISGTKPETYPTYTRTRKEAAEFRISQIQEELNFLREILAEKEPEVIVCDHPNELCDRENDRGYMCEICGAEFWLLTNVYPIAWVKE